jgi:integrase
VRPTKVTVAGYMGEWLDGLRLRDTTVALYRRLNRLHVEPHIGSVRLDLLTPEMLDRLYGTLERGGLSLSTSRKVHTLIYGALSRAVSSGRLPMNPAAKANPPSAVEAAPAEMKVWTPQQIGSFLRWAKESRPEWYPMWHVLFATGVRRGELVGLRWSDVDLARQTLTVRRSVSIISGEGPGTRRIVIGPPKNRKVRIVALDSHTIALLKGWRLLRAELGLVLVTGDAYVFGGLDGNHRDPVTLAATFGAHLHAAQRKLGPDLPVIRFHDSRHSHATALLLARTPVQVAAERIGDDPATMLRVYAHVLPGQQRQAAEAVAALVVT